MRINPPKFGGGLKFEPDAGIEQKGAFCKGLWETNMNAYVYKNKTLHINRYRRKGNGSLTTPGPKGTSYDRRRPKIRQGIILVDFDRRQKDDPNYSGPERRSGVDRRSGKDRRQYG